MTNWKALCRELVTAIETNCKEHLISHDLNCAYIKTDTALAQPEPQGPTDEELIQLAIDTRLYRFQATAGDPIQYEMTEQQIHAFARAVLARWGRSTSEENLND